MSRPERDLTVLWQRHLPERYRGADRESLARALGRDVEEELVRSMRSGELDRGDLVVTIARRPSLYTTRRT